MSHCLTLYTKTPSWLKKVGMTRNEATVYCVIYDYIRNGLPAHPTYAELAEELWSDDTSPCPTVARNAVSGLIEKGFIAQPFRGNSHGRANEYTLLVTLYELFQIVDKKNPGYFSDAQRAAYKEDLNIEISHQDRPANNIPTLPAKPAEQETIFDDDFLNDCGLDFLNDCGLAQVIPDWGTGWTPDDDNAVKDVKDMDPQQKAYFNKQENTEWDDSDIPF